MKDVFAGLRNNPLVRALLFAGLTALLLFLLRRVNISGQGLENLELMSFDWRVRHFTSSLQVKNARHRGEIVIVGIDGASFAALKETRNMRWPWNRRIYAEMLDQLTQAGARVVAFDVFFAESSRHTADPGQDAALVEAVRRSKVVVMAESAEDPLLPELKSAAPACAFIEHVRDPDAISRRSRLIPSLPVGSPWSLALTVAMKVRGQTGEALQAATSSDGRIARLTLPPVFRNREGKVQLLHPRLEIPLSGDGDMLVNWFDQALTRESYFPPIVSAYEVLIGRELERFRDRIVLIGATARDLHDDFPTPNSIYYPSRTIPGVMIHANALATLLENRFLHPVSSAVEWAGTLTLLFLLALVHSRAGARNSILATLAALAAVLLLAVAGFYFAWVLPIVLPAAGITLLFLIMSAWRFFVEEAEKRFIKSIFKQYVTEEVVEEILADPDALLRLGGDLRDVTVLFADIRNFTSLSESLPPEQVVELLNDFFERMNPLVLAHHGTLDKYLGDGFLVLFGVPVRHGDPAVDAVRCALAMQQAMRRMIDDCLAARRRPPDGIGIGIHCGEAVVGNIGSVKHKEYTAIGRVVNLAARIVAITPPEKIYVSEELRRRLGDGFALSSPLSASFKGIDQDSVLYAVLAEKSVPGGEIA